MSPQQEETVWNTIRADLADDVNDFCKSNADVCCQDDSILDEWVSLMLSTSSILLFESYFESKPIPCLLCSFIDADFLTQDQFILVDLDIDMDDVTVVFYVTRSVESGLCGDAMDRRKREIAGLC